MPRPFRTAARLLIAAALALPAAAKDDALDLVPAHAATVGMVSLAEMRSSPLSSFLFAHVDRMSTDGEAEKFLLDAGLQPHRDVDTVVLATAPRTNLGFEADVLVIAEGRFQPERLTAALIARGAVKKDAYIVFPQSAPGDGDRGAVAFLSRSLAIAGNERAVTNALAARAGGGTGFVNRGTLAPHLRSVGDATAWAVIDVARVARLARAGTIDTGSGQAGVTLQAALKSVSTVAVWAKDSGDQLEVGATALSSDAETLALLDDAIRGALAALRIVAQEKAPEMVSVLRRFDIGRTSAAISVEGSIPAETLRELLAKRLALKQD